jgi:hypothetical protein
MRGQPGQSFVPDPGLLLTPWKLHDEPRPSAQVTLHADHALVRLDNSASDVKAETQPAVAACRSSPLEAVEDPRLFPFVDADSMVPYDNSRYAVLARDLDEYGSSPAIFDRVGEKIGDDLHKAHLIPVANHGRTAWVSTLKPTVASWSVKSSLAIRTTSQRSMGLWSRVSRSAPIRVTSNRSSTRLVKRRICRSSGANVVAAASVTSIALPRAPRFNRSSLIRIAASGLRISCDAIDKKSSRI